MSRRRLRNRSLNSLSDVLLERLSGLHPKAIDLSLSRIERLLTALGNPQSELPPVVHVAGTNGKGSLIAYLRAFLESAGYRVNVFTSPHLVSFNERIRLGGRLIDDDLLVSVLDQCERVNNGRAITYFEVITAAAFLAFRRWPADIVLLETGLGGRLDATNVVERPLLTALSPISMDHQRFLGDSLAEIAAEKAGIIKSGTICVSASQEAVADKAIASRAAELGSPLLRQGGDWNVQATNDGFVFDNGESQRRFPRPALAGIHQIQNAGLAIACLGQLAGFAVSDNAISEGLGSVEWPGRLQRLEHGRLVEGLSDGWELWLDGGHNPSAGEALASHARQWRDMPLYIIVGMVKGKDRQGFIRPLANLTKGLFAVPIIGHKNSSDAEDIARTARDLGLDAKPYKNITEALGGIAGIAKEPGRVLITGSLFLVGEVLKKSGL